MNNIFIESNLLSNLADNNNCLINKLDTNKRVLICNYNSNNIISSSNYTRSCRLENANVNNTLIFTYINIPLDEFYKFRVMNGNTVYSGNCRIYLNNYNNLILNKTNTINETKYDVIKKGLYMLCIDVPKTNNTTTIISFTLEFDKKPIGSIHPDKLLANNWQSIDNLLFDNCTNILSNEPLTLINMFFNSTNEYCKLNNNINSQECINFYNTINDRLYDVYNSKINNNIYPNPIDGQYDPWSITNDNWALDLKNDRTTFGSCGINAIRTRNRPYYDPRYGGNANRLDPHTSESQSRNINCHTDTWTRNEWNALGTTNTTIPSTIVEAQFNSDVNVIRKELNKYTKKSLYDSLTRFSNNSFLSTSHIDWVNGEVSSYELTGADQTSLNLSRNNRIFKNVLFSNGYTWNSSDDTTSTITMQSNGELVCIRNNLIVWSSNTSGNNNAKLCVTRNGRLIIYSSNKTILWSYDNNGNSFSTNNDLFYEFYYGQIAVKIGKTDTFYYGEKTNVLYPNLFYSNNYEIKNGRYRASMQNDGNFVVYMNTIWEWASRTFGNNNARLGMQSDGNLVLYSSSGAILQKSDTNGNAGAYLELTACGALLIKNKNHKVIKIYIDTNRNSSVRDHIRNNHWNGSPWTLFSDKKGRVWKATWPDLDVNFNVTSFSRTSRATGSCRATPRDIRCPFRGWRKDENNKEWQVNQRDLLNANGYDNELNNARPVTWEDSSEFNYRQGDRRNFINDQNSFRKPPQLTDGIEKPNYIPGYIRLSYVTDNNTDDTFNFLVAARCGTCDDQAFVVYNIINNRDMYRDDIINNHPDLVLNIILHLSGLTRNDLSTTTINNNLSSFTNKSYFINPEKCNIKNIFNDENCRGVIYDQYKNYLSSMDNYCENNIWDPECTNYISKEFIDEYNNIIKPNEDNKILLLNKQEQLCTDVNNVLKDRCIYLNTKNPQNLAIVSRKVNLNDPKFAKFSSYYGDEGLFQNCMVNENIISNVEECSKIENNDLYKNQLLNKKKAVCKEDKNLLNSECLKFNKEKQIDSIKEECKYNKTDNCKKLCSEYSEEFSDICFWENNQLYIILAIIFAVIIGGFVMYKKKNSTTSTKTNISQNNNKP